MDRRKMIFWMLLLGAGAGPFLLEKSGAPSLMQKWNSFINSLGSNDPTLSLHGTDGHDLPGSGDLSSSGIRDADLRSSSPYAAWPESAPTVELKQALSFDVTPTWVVNHWPRVSTSLAELNMQGLRVAFVTGTELNDVHGSLTYYFDNRQLLQRISFQGYTGDASRLIDLLTKYHGLRPQKTLDAVLLTKRWNGKPRSVLWVGHAPLVRADAPNSRYLVKLEINRTDGPYRLSDEFAQFLGARQDARR